MKDYVVPIVLAILFIVVPFLFVYGNAAFNKSVNDMEKSLVRVVNSAVTMERMFIELCTDPHNKAVCDRYEIVMRER